MLAGLILAALQFWLVTAVQQHLSDVFNLNAEADYRFVTLKWEYPKYAPLLYGFQVSYCELQDWGPNRCRNKVIDVGSGLQEAEESSDARRYSVIVSGLRMATNYSFEVRPMEARRTRYLLDRSEAGRIVVHTKGFSARASLCLPEVSEIEVATGPFFSGRIAVEGEGGCWLEGDPNSAQEVYTLRIQHSACGSSKINSTAVATFVLVQENLPILTHSTRRFMVLCTFHPETLTVRAGLNLPSSPSTGSGVAQSAEVDHVPEMDGNEVHAAALLQDHHQRAFSGEAEAQLVLATIAVIVCAVVVALAVWWNLPFRNISSGDGRILSEDCGEGVSENVENCMRAEERGQATDECQETLDELENGVVNPILVEDGPTQVQPSAVLLEVQVEPHTQSEA